MCVIRKAVMKMTIDGNSQWNVTIELYRRSRCGTLLTQVVPRLLCRYPKMCINHFFCFCYLFCLGHFPFLSHFMLILLLVSRYQFLGAVFGTTLMHLIHHEYKETGLNRPRPRNNVELASNKKTHLNYLGQDLLNLRNAFWKLLAPLVVAGIKRTR